MKKSKLSKYFLSLLMISAGFIIGCNNPMEGERSKAGEAKEDLKEASGNVYAVNVDKSILEWKGSKPTGEHYGTIELSEGKFFVDEGEITGGEFTIDMSSIVNLDIEDPETNAKLVNHLKSADFFEVEEYPYAKFVITDILPLSESGAEVSQMDEIIPTHIVTGNLTMKDITRSISFNAVIENTENEIRAFTPQFIIDRSEWNVRYGSKSFFDDLKDNFIDDEIGLKIAVHVSI